MKRTTLVKYFHLHDRRRTSVWLFVVIWTLLVIGVSSLVSIIYWDKLNVGESSSATIRNFALIVSVAIALPLAIWRSIVAEKQALTSYRGLLNERYQKGAEMLGSNVLSVRLGGIYALRHLSEEHPDEYHVQILRLFCAFVRHPIPVKENVDNSSKFVGHIDSHPDVHAIMEAIFHRDKKQINLEKKERFRIDFRGANLHELNWEDFTTINLRGADLSHADLSGVNFAYHAFMYDESINLSGVSLYCTILSGANLAGVLGLTQRGLELAYSDPENPPYLRGAVDANTNKELIWKE